MKPKHVHLVFPFVLVALALLAACAPASSLRLVLSKDADVQAELERFIAWNGLEASARKTKACEWEIVFTRVLPEAPDTPFIALRDFIDFTDPADPPTMTLRITEKNPEVVKVLGIDDNGRDFVYALDTDRGEFSRYSEKVMGQTVEERAWDVPVDKDLPDLYYKAEMKAGDPALFADEAARQKFDELMRKLSDVPQAAEHTLAFGTARRDLELGDMSADFGSKRTVSFVFDRDAVLDPLAMFGEGEDKAGDVEKLRQKSSKTFKLLILFPKLATYLEAYSFKPQ
jgi:hypothetical protein